MTEDIKQYTLQELVESLAKAKEVIEELKANESLLKDEVKDRLHASKISGTKCGDYLVSIVKRVWFPNFPLSKARDLGAIKETVDTTILKKLMKKGVEVEHQISEFVTVRFMEKK